MGSSQIIATVYTSSRGVEIQERIRQIDDKIKVLESSSIDTSYLTSDVSKIDAKLYDYLLKIRTGSMKEYNNFIINVLGTVDAIGSVQSSFVMNEIKHSYALYF